MPDLKLSSAQSTTMRADALVVGIRNSDDRVDFVEPLNLLSLSSKPGSTVRFPAGSLAKAKIVIGVSLPEEPTGEDLRRAAACGIKAAKGSRTVAMDLHPASVEDVVAVAEGIHLGCYSFDEYKSERPKDDESVQKVTILSQFARQTATLKGIERATQVAACVNRVRDWVNSPPGDLRPPEFARQIADFAGDDLRVSIWDEKRLIKEKCGGILGVGQGSDSPPRLVKLTYNPPKATKHLALVGKGITFDSGGLSIKPGASMQTMKLDMAGAAAVVGTAVAIARLGLPIRVTAFASLAENMPSGSAIRPGDVLTIRGGQTVEVHNTDAEGRLVLADALVLATESKPDLIVDVATLTGACMVALGMRTAGILSNDERLAHNMHASSKVAGESMWPLPIVEEMEEIVKSSSLADLRQHNPKPFGGTLFAAAFLREFVADYPWVHLDIAGPSFNEFSAYDYTPVGGTGVGVRTLVQLASELSTAK